ncbi:Hpt domain-containing protein [Oscillibacter hominis]|uniref:Hpt domain-containing protein n=1 Tax=Oscillibacter hominis TaxID=2763056 RepID=A0A7G9B4D4_9FIRM|nr:Hpt domain-containing protein [Oscillibacter hominis]QNL44415.1 Hpt domain-containing protein [Oscillibacter hominis]
MRSFQEVFEGYGADYQTTMSRFLGNEEMYLRFLNMLFQDDNLQKLGEAIEHGDLTAAFEAAHTLKGVTGNLGLTPLYKEVCAIVEPLRNREERDYSQAYQRVQEEFGRADAFLEQLKGGR